MNITGSLLSDFEKTI